MSLRGLFLCFWFFREADADGCRFVPRYFEKDIESGVPRLTLDGEAAIEEELKEDPAYTPEDAHSTMPVAAP